MIDRIVHDADVLTLNGASYRLRGRGIDSHPGIKTRIRQTNETTTRWPRFRPSLSLQVGSSSPEGRRWGPAVVDLPA